MDSSATALPTAAARRSEPHNASSLTSPTATASAATALKPTSTPGSPSSPTKESASSDGYATTATSVTWPCLVQSQRPGHEPTPTPTNTGPWSDGCSPTNTPPASRTTSDERRVGQVWRKKCRYRGAAETEKQNTT